MPHRLTKTEINSTVAHLPGWHHHGHAIEKEWELGDFAAALAFVNAIGAKAQEADHHPDILLHGWNKVKVVLSTHAAHGVTDLDLKLAQAIDALRG